MTTFYAFAIGVMPDGGAPRSFAIEAPNLATARMAYDAMVAAGFVMASERPMPEPKGPVTATTQDVYGGDAEHNFN